MTDLPLLSSAEWWVIAAALFGIAEIMIPGVFLMWIGLAALAVAGVAALLPVALGGQFLIFALVAVAAVYGARTYLAKRPTVSADPLLNDRAGRLVGAIVTAVEPVDALSGRVKVGDGVWSARGAEAGAGDRLRVTGNEGGVLIVERV